MKQEKPGFTVTEFLVYFFLLMLVTTLTVHWVVSSHVRIAYNRAHTLTFIECSCAHDVLARDLRCAPTEVQSWKVFGDGQWVWRTPEGDVGWELDDGLLVRSHGLYNMVTRTWIKRIRSLVARGVERCSLSRIGVHDAFSSVASTLTAEKHHYAEKRVSMLRNRRIS